jgi:hypothetical protein
VSSGPHVRHLAGHDGQLKTINRVKVGVSPQRSAANAVCLRPQGSGCFADVYVRRGFLRRFYMVCARIVVYWRALLSGNGEHPTTLKLPSPIQNDLFPLPVACAPVSGQSWRVRRAQPRERLPEPHGLFCDWFCRERHSKRPQGTGSDFFYVAANARAESGPERAPQTESYPIGHAVLSFDNCATVG